MSLRPGFLPLIAFVALGGAQFMEAGLLDPVHVRAKADAPLEADQPGYEVNLFDSHSESLLVSGYVSIPDSFGKVDVAALDVADADGKKVVSVAITPAAAPPPHKTLFEFNLRRDHLKNSTMSVAHETPDALDCVVIHLGTFEVRDFKSKSGPPSPPKVWLALAEQGIPGERDGDFTLTDKIPLVEGQTYGFRMYLRGEGRTFPVRVEQTLPKPPKTWSEPEIAQSLKISEDGRTASTTVMIPGDKLFGPMWTIADGDPEGDYVVKVFVRDELVKTFTFHVEKELTVPTP